MVTSNLPRRELSVLFTDLEDSVAIRQRYGERLGDAIRQTIVDLTVSACTRVSDRFRYLKSTGDGALIVFDRPEDAVRAGLEIIEASNGVVTVLGTTVKLRVRVGVDAGPVLCEGGESPSDVHGDHVNLSARIMGMAAGGQLLTSAQVREEWAAAGLPGVEWVNLGGQWLKGFRAPCVVWEAFDTGRGTESAPMVDGLSMAKRPEVAAARLSGRVLRSSWPISLLAVLPLLASDLPFDVIAAAVLAALLFVCWRSFASIGEARDRGEVIATLLFVSLAALLSSPLLITAYTRIDPYGLFLAWVPASAATPITINLVLNVGLAHFASLTFVTIYYRVLFSDRTALYRCTFGSVGVPFTLVYVVVALLSQSGSEAYFLVAFFPMVIAFLALVGYTHPFNRVDLFTARVLLGVCATAIVVGFPLMMAGLLYSLAFLTPDAPERFSTMLWSAPIDWSQMGYAIEDFQSRHRAGFVWMVLSSSMFLILAVGVPTTLAIYHHQYLPSLSDERVRVYRGR